MKKVLFSAVACLAIASTALAANAENQVNDYKSYRESQSLVQNSVVTQSFIESIFGCAGEVNVLDKNGKKVRSYQIDGSKAYNHLDCLGIYLNKVKEVEATLSEGETTTGSVLYI